MLAVPLIAPLVVFRLRPVGKPGLMAQAKGAVPPLAVTGVNGVAATFFTNVVLATACVTVSTGGVMAMVNAASAKTPMLSVTLIV